MRGYLVAALIGTVVGSAFFVFSDALSPQSGGGCIEGQVPCPTPPLLTWSAIRPGWAFIGAGIGALLGLGLHALWWCERRRRDRVGL